jgi:hypothetical protein
MLWSCSTFLRKICTRLRIDFGVHDNDELSIISLHEQERNGNDPNNWPLFYPSSELLKNYFQNNLKNIAFYVKYTSNFEYTIPDFPLLVHGYDNIDDCFDISDNSISSNSQNDTVEGSVSVSITTVTQDEPSQLTCVICLTNQRSLLFTPCNHLCTCSTCGIHNSITNCPICRVVIVNRMVVYL